MKMSKVCRRGVAQDKLRMSHISMTHRTETYRPQTAFIGKKIKYRREEEEEEKTCHFCREGLQILTAYKYEERDRRIRNLASCL